MKIFEKGLRRDGKHKVELLFENGVRLVKVVSAEKLRELQAKQSQLNSGDAR